MEYHIVYAKFDGCKSFKAFDVNEGRQVGNLIYASLVENTEDTRSKLQKLVSSVFSTSEAYMRLPTCLHSLTSKALKLLHPSNLA